ncbi:immunity 49 family protein [Gallaecimonas pentaromativorans]|uniref:immunity 49 family protein n=1 Tax=Gallaecimonas pentaromativorans TaxID=584787 RepID=UPI003A8EADEF
MIERHYQNFNIPYTEKMLDRFENNLLPKRIASVQRLNGGEVLGGSINPAIKAFGESIILSSPHQTCIRHLNLVKELGAANFAYVINEGITFKTHIDGHTIELTGQPKTDYVDTDSWIKVHCAAVMLRDFDAVNILNLVSEATFISANLRPDSFDLALVDILKGIFQGDSDLATLLEKALLCDDIDDMRLPYAHHILSPLLPLVRCIFTANAEAEFNQELREAVAMHKAYWSKDELEAQGWVSLPLTALAVIAKDAKGYKMSFETDYIPAWIVNREF